MNKIEHLKMIMDMNDAKFKNMPAEIIFPYQY